jgi:hypothetical protein
VGARMALSAFPPGYRYYRRDGTPYDGVLAWAQDFETSENRIVRQETLWHGAFLSTVFLGLNHAWNPQDRPLVFETMLFAGKHDLAQERYTTEAEALAGHAALHRYWSRHPLAIWRVWWATLRGES